MASDLPAFDSVWIDALQQIGRLTPFQSHRLDAGEGDTLRVGPCVLVDRLGPARTGRTFVARHRESGDHCVLKFVEPDDEADDVPRRTRELVEGLRAVRHPSIVGPDRFEEHHGRHVAVSRWVDGPNLAELCVRRGRFGARVVTAIARQLAEGLAALESGGLVHGDLRSPNVRLTSEGRVVLVDAGIRPLLERDVRLRDGDDPGRFDGIAPERIGNGRPPDAVSEVYAFGCLLWTLLAGRPPFPTGDVLGKLAAHRGRDVPDIGEIAPDTPPELVRLVAATTDRDPRRRPASFAEIVRGFGSATSGDRSTLAGFLASFDRSVPRLPRRLEDEAGGSRGGLIAAALLVAGLCSAMLHDGLRTHVVGFATSTGQLVAGLFESESKPDDTSLVGTDSDEPSDTRLELPAPDAEGVVLLDRAGPYRATELSAVGPLVLRAAEGVRPVVEVDDVPLKLWGEELRIENVTVRASGPPVAALVLARSQRVSLSGVTLDGTKVGDGPDAPRSRYLLAWKPLDERDATGGEIEVANTLLLGDQPGLFASVPPRMLSARQTLKAGAGAFVEFATNPAPGSDATLELANVTLREATHLVRCVRRRADAGVMWIEADDCVFDLAGPRASLLAWIGSSTPTPDRVQFEGRGCITSPNVPTAILVGREGRPVDASEHGNVIVEGLIASRIEFAGPLDDPAGSVVRRFDGPRIGSGRPGFDVRRIAAEPGSRFD